MAHPGLTFGLIGLVLAIGFDALCLLDIAQAPAVRTLPREAWALLCIITTPLGGLLYLMYGRVSAG
jgi:hypothetical protein